MLGKNCYGRSGTILRGLRCISGFEVLFYRDASSLVGCPKLLFSAEGSCIDGLLFSLSAFPHFPIGVYSRPVPVLCLHRSS